MFDIAKPIVGLCAAWRIGLQCARPGLHSESGDLDLESLGTWNPSLDLEPTSCGRKRGLYRDGEPSARPRRRRRQLSLQERVLERVLMDASAQFEQDCARRHAAMVRGGRVCCRERSRGIAVMVLMTRRYGTMPTTFALAVSLFDRFLEARASGEVQLDCFAGVATAWSSAPVEGIQQFCAPLSCLMMAIKFLEVRAPSLSDVVKMANRLCLESQTRSPPGNPRGTEEDEGSLGLSVERINASATPGGAHLFTSSRTVALPRHKEGQANPSRGHDPNKITTDDLRDWEKLVWQALGYHLNDVTSVDVLQGLVQQGPAALAAVQDAGERKLKAAMCIPCLRQHSPIDLAVAALLLSADEGPDEHVTRKQVQDALPRLVSRPSLCPSLSLLEKVVRRP